MSIRKFRWSKVYESTEEELKDFLASRNITSTHWSAEGFDMSDAQVYDTDSTLWCAEGSLTFRSGDTAKSLQPGDAMFVLAGTSFVLEAGMTGYICYKS